MLCCVVLYCICVVLCCIVSYGIVYCIDRMLKFSSITKKYFSLDANKIAPLTQSNFLLISVSTFLCLCCMHCCTIGWLYTIQERVYKAPSPCKHNAQCTIF